MLRKVIIIVIIIIFIIITIIAKPRGIFLSGLEKLSIGIYVCFFPAVLRTLVCVYTCA